MTESKELALHYMDTLLELARESFIVLDEDLKVAIANPVFYETFHVNPAETEKRFLYDLGNGQWNIPALRSLLEKVLPQKKVVKAYEVTHTFETIGAKTMLLNAQQLDHVHLILIAIEDITERVNLKTELAKYTKGLEDLVTKRTTELKIRVDELERLNKVMVGRELKMIELKAQIETLKKANLKNKSPQH